MSGTSNRLDKIQDPMPITQPIKPGKNSTFCNFHLRSKNKSLIAVSVQSVFKCFNWYNCFIFMIGTWPAFVDLSKRLIQRKLNNLDLTDEDDILHNFCPVYSNDCYLKWLWLRLFLRDYITSKVNPFCYWKTYRKENVVRYWSFLLQKHSVPLRQPRLKFFFSDKIEMLEWWLLFFHFCKGAKEEH